MTYSKEDKQRFDEHAKALGVIWESLHAGLEPLHGQVLVANLQVEILLNDYLSNIVKHTGVIKDTEPFHKRLMIAKAFSTPRPDDMNWVLMDKLHSLRNAISHPRDSKVFEDRYKALRTQVKTVDKVLAAASSNPDSMDELHETIVSKGEEYGLPMDPVVLHASMQIGVFLKLISNEVFASPPDKVA